MTRTDSDQQASFEAGQGDDRAAREARMLEACFAAARDRAPEISGDVFARLLADAAAEQPRPALAVQTARIARNPAENGLWPGLVAAFRGLGGLRLAGGLASATLVGLWLGFAGAGQMAQAAGQSDGTQVAVQGGAAEAADTWDLLPDYALIGLDLVPELEG